MDKKIKLKIDGEEFLVESDQLVAVVLSTGEREVIEAEFIKAGDIILSLI